MHDDGEVGADGEVCDGDQVRTRQFQEFQGLDDAEKLLANPTIEHHLGHH